MLQGFADLTSSPVVAASRQSAAYTRESPFSPEEHYPEYPWDILSREENPAYHGVRSVLLGLGLDAHRFGTPQWNPLATIISPGYTVVIKPNLVRNFRETQAGDGDCLTAHGSVIRAVLDYVFLALDGRGRVIIADAPHNDAEFGALREKIGFAELQEFFRREGSCELEMYDLRPVCARKIEGIIVGHAPLPGDPAGYVKVDLGSYSAFCEVEQLCELLYGSEYDMGELYEHHRDGRHEYLLSKTVLDADAVIGIPKLKTHKKVGLTAALKNLVGVNGNKNWLPHHREGGPARGGDQFPDDRLRRRLERWAASQFKRHFHRLGSLRGLAAGPAIGLGRRVFGDTNGGTIRSGNWYGNDTTWRMVLDLNRAFLYADAAGRLHGEPVRKYLNIVDGMIAGEGNGPLDPTPVQAGVIAAGFNPVAVDMACSRLMGFDYRKMPMLHRAFDASALPLANFGPDDVCVQLGEDQIIPLSEVKPPADPFVPHFGWKGHIELPSQVGSRNQGACALPA